MRRFFIDPQAISGSQAVLSGPEVKHIRKVLRLHAGNHITLFDGTGSLYISEILEIDKQQILLSILEKKDYQVRPPLLHLGQGLLKKKKMEFIVQKATELGVSSIHPFHSGHCSLTYRPQSQEERWQRISLEACKQCGQPLPPDILSAGQFQEVLNQEADLKLICWEKESSNGLEIVRDRIAQAEVKSVLLLIGPEGGFSQAEVKAAEQCGFVPISLGSLTLRAETASIAAISVVQFLLGRLESPA